MTLPYRVTYLDPKDGQRHEYGRASDRAVAEVLMASLKAQECGCRDARIEQAEVS